MNENQPLEIDVSNVEMTDETRMNEQAHKDLKAIRHIINAEALVEADSKHKQQAREYVTKVVSEALNDRQLQDESVSRALSPIVEKAVQISLVSQRDQFVDYLYPLVGDLVRKFSITFVRDFIEKTNELIENSLTFRSLKWRFKAWKAGVSFSKFVASQIYTYQVHQVFLIHRETGILLNSASREGEINENSDVVSAMLSAISDFVSDSFKPKQGQIERTDKQQLDEIKTDEYILYVKQAPQALLVAAVTGNISPIAKDKLQSTLEQIQSFYLPNLKAFTGDITSFASSSRELNECLLAEEKDLTPKTKKPWQAILLFILVFAGIAYLGVVKWQTSNLVDSLYDLPSNQGIVINRAYVNGIHDIQLTLLQDASAISINDWVSKGDIEIKDFEKWVKVNSVPFISLSIPVIQQRVKTLVEKINSSKENSNSDNDLQYNAESGQITGKLSTAQNILFNKHLADIQGISKLNLEFDIAAIKNTSSIALVNQRLVSLLSAEISLLQINFSTASDQVTAIETHKLRQVVTKFNDLKQFASELKLDVKLLILGASDSVGNSKINQALSASRAENTAAALVSLGVSRNELMTSGLGVIADAPADTNIRKTIIHVILNKL